MGWYIDGTFSGEFETVGLILGLFLPAGHVAQYATLLQNLVYVRPQPYQHKERVSFPAGDDQPEKTI